MPERLTGSKNAEAAKAPKNPLDSRRRRIPATVGLAALLCTAAIAPAQAQDDEPVVSFALTDVTRLESWSFFEPRAGGGDPTYTLLGNRAALAVAMRSRHVDLAGAFQYAQLLGLPSDATGPGPLGPGASYFGAAGTSSAYQLYIRAVSARVKSRTGFSLEAGRMNVTSGADGPLGNAASLPRDLLSGRLLGGANWTPFERAFDGARVDVARDRWRASSALVWPTQGAFEESANLTMTAVRVVTGSLALAWPASRERHGELQAFAAHYRDRRSISARPDNSGRLAAAIDVSIATFGASHIAILPLRGATLDTAFWIAGQTGDWYGTDHGAFSVIGSAGIQLPIRSRPRIAGGLIRASGDDDGRDARHGTFFPMLPTTPPALLAGTFAQMNLQHVFADVRLHPSRTVALSASFNRLSLVRPEDRWYSGTGATASRGTYFGFSGRSSFFATSLGTLVSGAADLHVSDRWQLKTEVGIMQGGAIVRRLFSGHRLFVFALESRLVLGG